MKGLNFLILFNLTVLSATSQVSSDTVRCYGVKELRKIAEALVKGKECDTLLKISEAQILNRDSVIVEKNRIIKTYQSESSLKEAIISEKNHQIDTINLQLKQTKRKLFFIKLGWLTSSVALTAGVVYFGFR